MNILDSFFGAGAFQEDAAPAPYVAPLERRDYATAVPLLKAALNKRMTTRLPMSLLTITLSTSWRLLMVRSSASRNCWRAAS